MKRIPGQPLAVMTVVLLSCRLAAGQVHDLGLTKPSGFAADSSWIDSTLSTLSLEARVWQLIMPRVNGTYFAGNSDAYDRIARLVRDRGAGGIIVARGDVYEEAMLVNRLQSIARVPLLVAADYERGVAMRIRRATAFPDAMAVGATRNPDYAYQEGRVIAEEGRAVGVLQNYAPVADVNTNASNPVINTRSFGDNLGLVQAMVGASVRGMVEGRMLPTLKHFPGHGDTGVDSHLEMPVIPYGRERLDSLELAAFRQALRFAPVSVMVAHLAVPAIDSASGIPSSLSARVVSGVLRHDMGFAGLVVTDAMEMQGVVRGFSAAQSAVMAVKAGVDILLTPPDDEVAATAIINAVRHGDIPESRIDESVRRILGVKRWLGLDRSRLVDPGDVAAHVATRQHRDLAKTIARDAITVLRNEGGLLPLRPGSGRNIAIVSVSDAEDNRIEVNRPDNPASDEPAGEYFAQLVSRRDPDVGALRIDPSSTTSDLGAVLSRLRNADLVLLPLYVKVRTASGRIGLPPATREFLDSIRKAGKPTVVVSFGNPYVVAEFPWARGILCAYGDVEPLVEASVEALFGEIDVRGKLPVTIPNAFPFGSGMEMHKVYLRRDPPEFAGFDPAGLMRVDDVVTSAIRDSAFPAAQVAIVKDGLLVYDKSFGTFTYDISERDINGSTLFDLASLTKVFATTPAVMKLCDEGRLSLDDPVSKYVPAFAEGEKARITIRLLLLHRAGFPPFRKFWEFCSSPAAMIDSVFATPLVASPGDTTIYSDLGMITMGKIVEKVTGMPLSDYVRKEFYGPLGMTHTMFTPPPDLRDRCAPTEIDSAWRKRLVQGTVHDENAWYLGGVSGHAGLFSTASDLAVFMQMLLSGGSYGGVQYLSPKIVKEFTATPQPGADRFLGWDRKSPEGSSAGTLFSASSFGHTGFTGTSVWTDPVRDLSVIFLTNRVYPTRANSKIFRVRPALHDAVIQALTSSAGEAPAR